MEQFDKYIGKVFKDYLTGKYFLVLEIDSAGARYSRFTQKIKNTNENAFGEWNI